MILGGWVAQGSAEGVGRLRGVVQREGQGFANQRIMLIRFGPNQDVQRFPGQTDAEGRFLFENLDTGPTWTYVVGIRYQEQLYRSDSVILAGAEPVEVVLRVGEAAAQAMPESQSLPALRIGNHLMVVIRRDDHLEVREVVRLVNASGAPYPAAGRGPAGMPGISLHLPLPQGYSNMSQVQGLTPAAMRVESTGLSYTAPIPPGEHQVVYTYHLPWHDELTTVLVERTLGTATLDILVEDERLHATSDLPFGGRVPIEPHVFAHFRGMQLEAHTRSWLQLTPRQAPAAFVSIGAYGLIVGIALCGGLLPLYGLRHRLASQGRTTTDALHGQQDMHSAGRDLLYSMAHLDNEYEQGRVAATAYQQRRQAYKEQLVKIVEHCQSMPSNKAP